MELKKFKTKVTTTIKKAKELIYAATGLLDMETIPIINLQNQRQKLVEQMRAMEGFQAEVDNAAGENTNGDPEKTKMIDEMTQHLTHHGNDEVIMALHKTIDELQERIIDEEAKLPAAPPAAPAVQDKNSAKDAPKEKPQEANSDDDDDEEEIPFVAIDYKKPGTSARCESAKNRKSNIVGGNLFNGDESIQWFDHTNGDVSQQQRRGPQAGRANSSMKFQDIHSILNRCKGRDTPDSELPENHELERIFFKRLSEMEGNQEKLTELVITMEKDNQSIKQDIRMIADSLLNNDASQEDNGGCCEANKSERPRTEQCIGFDPKTGRPSFQPTGRIPQQVLFNGHSAPSNNTPSSKEAVKAEQLKASLMSSLMMAVKPFTGEEHKYLEFMAQFDAVVHNNHFLPDAMKQSILFTLLSPKLSLEHSPTEYSTAGYYRLRESLHRQFGRVNTQMAILMDLLETLEFPSNDTKMLSSSLHTYATYANKLKPFGTNPDDPYFIKAFISKLPEKLALALNKKRSRAGYNITLDALMEEAHNFVEFETIYKKPVVKEVYQAGIQAIRSQEQFRGPKKPMSYPQQNGQRRDNKGGKKNFVPPSKETPCVLCGAENHSASMCNLPLDKKLQAIHSIPLCYNCLGSGHGAADCKSRFRCFNCQGKHYTGVCTLPNNMNRQVNVMAFLNQDDDEELEQQLFHGEEAGTSEF